MTIIIGLTGGIGSGKSTVADLFAQKGIDIIDADIIAREVVAPNTVGLEAIVARYGQKILTPQGYLDRSTLREKIFSNPEEKAWIDQLLHPKILQEMKDISAQTRSHYCLWVAPLLIETNLHKLCDRVLVVDLEEKIQITRTANRDKISTEQVKKILTAQASRRDKLAYADDIIHNNAGIEALNQQVNTLHDQYLLLPR